MPTFLADKKHFKTRASDSSNLITFETGEYQKNNILDVVKMPDDIVYKVVVTEATQEDIKYIEEGQK